MPLDTGIWTAEEALTGHDFSYRLAQWIGEYLPKNEFLVDVGCGTGAYLRYLHDVGFSQLHGIEGTPQNFEYGKIIVSDLAKGDVVLFKGASIGISGSNNGFEKNAICLEVGEHIPEEYLEEFMRRLCYYVGKHGKLILSWAVPGQDGIGHVSCRHNIWVINEFEKRGFKLLADDSLKARAVVEERLNYFRNTIMIFEKL